jgi:hypothetical protein
VARYGSDAAKNSVMMMLRGSIVPVFWPGEGLPKILTIDTLASYRYNNNSEVGGQIPEMI